MTTALENLDILGAEGYAARGYPHEEWALLRREAPVYRYRRGDFEPFWAITRYEDIVWVSKQPELFLNRPRMAIFHKSLRPTGTAGAGRLKGGFRSLLNMDPPEHRGFRKLAFGWFTPSGIQRLQPRVEAITSGLLDKLERNGGSAECDFVTEVAAQFPLKVIAEILGVPEKDEGLVQELSNQGIGSQDDEFRADGLSARESRIEAIRALFGYFAELVADRRKSPREDLVSWLANARLKGKLLPDPELLSYFGLIAVAGHETTRNATSGGLLAFLENPGEWDRLRANPGLLDSAVEEILRWTSPVIQFARTAIEDVELRGEKIHAGDSVALFYPSANRDEAVFDQPDQFRIDRSPNPHLAFGIGEHFCLGANLARLELRVMFRQLLERFESFEDAGPVERLASSFVGGIKHIPIRYKLRSAGGPA